MIKKTDLTDSLWNFRLSSENPDINAAFDDTIPLPSTVSMMKKSPVTDERSTGYLTDPHKFEGYALYERTVYLEKPENCVIFLVLERTRTSTLWINGVMAGTQNSLCGSHRYDITDLVTGGETRITIEINNVTCPVGGGHMTSPDTQTNWLGITGGIYAEYCSAVRCESIRIYTDPMDESVKITGTLTGTSPADISLEVNGFGRITETVQAGAFSLDYSMKGCRLWSEHDPVTYTMKITCGEDVSETVFGMRRFEVQGTDFLLNGRKIFLRGKHDGMIFPLTGAAPTDKESWLKVMGAAKDHGINHYRFHTCCPPEAAFEAADELGIYMEPELPFWGTVEDELTPAQQYLVDEGFRILEQFGNHPSFFAMSMGNELWGSREMLDKILGGYKDFDDRHLYTQGSNNFQFWPCIVDNDDFFVGVRFSKERLFRGSYAMCDAPLGHIQTDAPNSNYSYDPMIKPASLGKSVSSGGTIEIQYGTGVKTVSVGEGGYEFVSHIPVVSHEVGQYFMYPDYNEIEKYTGVLKPYNLEIFRERLEAAGLGELADKYFRASGRFAAECYKNEIETALRSKELSGFQLLDIQDFTGQGTALVGILNAFMESKGVISPREWRSFCSEKVILGCLPKFTFTSGESVNMPVKIYNYSASSVSNPVVEITYGNDSIELSDLGSYRDGVYDIGSVTLKMPEVCRAEKLRLTLKCGEVSNGYDLWVYPAAKPSTGNIVTDWNEAKTHLAAGERVLFMPHAVREDKSIEGTYCTDFWNYPMFNSISVSMNKPVPVGTLGLLIDSEHPVFADFPTEIYSTPQWYDIVTDSRAAVLDGMGISPIVRTIDNCERNHDLGDIFEVNAGGGKLLVCTFRLNEKSASAPASALLDCLERYIASDSFAPVRTVDIDALDGIFAE
ncbi:MAG: beta-glucuronidase [Huintestinicola sp.]